jgi:hypothetical protein
MSIKTYTYKDFDDDDGYPNKRRKHLKHANNIRGKGMRTLNSYVEEDLYYDLNPDLDEDDLDDTIHENT